MDNAITLEFNIAMFYLINSLHYLNVSDSL